MAPVPAVLGLVLACAWYSGLPTVSGGTVITQLPGFDGRLPFELETGYIAVDELEEVNLFYYFVKSERSPADDPLLFWLTGGPGCTGLSGLAYEIGPFAFDIENYESGRLPTLIYREESWTRISSIIFLDSPVGTGFSYSEAAEENEWSDTKSSKRLHAFIRKWLVDHPEFISNPFYVAGDSYGGKMVPIVAQEVINGNEAGAEPIVNLQGYFAGNPVTSEYRFDEGTKVAFSHGMGLISDELYEETKESCSGDYITHHNVKCSACLDAVQQVWSSLAVILMNWYSTALTEEFFRVQNLVGIEAKNILDPNCDLESPRPKQFAADRYLIDLERNHLYSRRIPHKGCPEYKFLAVKSWVDNDAVREALGVWKGLVGEWTRCRVDLREKYAFDIPSAVPYHLNVTSRGFRSLVYSGDHDLNVNFVGTQAWIRSLNFSIIDDWRRWLVNGQVAGYTRTYANGMTFATVKAAGHTAASYKPKECLAMFERWISRQAL